MNWSEVDDALKKLKALLPARIGRRASQQVLSALSRLREGTGVDPADVHRALMTYYDTFRLRPALGSPFTLAETIAIAEASARKLTHIYARISSGAQLRGLDEREARGVGEHADALLPSFGAEDTELCASLALANVLSFGRHLIWGEPHNRNDHAPLEALFQSGSAFVREDAVPIGVIRDLGVVVAEGPALRGELGERWSPRRFVVRGFDGTVWFLDRDEDLRRFMTRWAPPIHAGTLASILHAITSIAPFDSHVELDEPRLADEWASGEAEIEDRRFAGSSASQLLGLDHGPKPEQRAKITVRCLPHGPTLRYARGDLTIVGLPLRP